MRDVHRACTDVLLAFFLLSYILIRALSFTGLAYIACTVMRVHRSNMTFIKPVKVPCSGSTDFLKPESGRGLSFDPCELVGIFVSRETRRRRPSEGRSVSAIGSHITSRVANRV